MTENQLRKEAKEFADKMQPITSHDCQDELDYMDFQIEYLIAKILDKDPHKCFCDENKPLRRLEDETEICCECEKPID